MRYRQDYGLYRRKTAKGRVVIYYTTYDAQGKRLPGRSTGKRTIGEARLYCNALMRTGRLIPERSRVPTFALFAEGWWLWDSCPYLKRRRARRTLARSYADIARKVLENHLLPAFGERRLDAITDVEIEDWLTSRREAGSGSRSANLYLSILTVMLNEAVRQHLIAGNPAARVSKLKEEVYAVEILTQPEVLSLFPNQWKMVWDSEEAYLANKLAACTGLRIGEVVGLRGVDFMGSYLAVRGQFTKYGFTDTKNHKGRNIPIPPGVALELARRKKERGDGYLFAVVPGEEPVSKDTLNRQLRSALERIGIGEEERQRRHLTFHGWRHFFNTTLRSANVTDSKVRAITGHGSKAMTDLYTHYDTREFREVRRVQAAVLPEVRPEKAAKAEKATTVVKAAKDVQATKSVKAAKAEKAVLTANVVRPGKAAGVEKRRGARVSGG
ncbi:MAG: site-specific integrase [Chlorobium sp.]|nr:site-specific integrase [Chlorobium sp.]